MDLRPFPHEKPRWFLFTQRLITAAPCSRRLREYSTWLTTSCFSQVARAPLSNTRIWLQCNGLTARNIPFLGWRGVRPSELIPMPHSQAVLTPSDCDSQEVVHTLENLFSSCTICQILWLQNVFTVFIQFTASKHQKMSWVQKFRDFISFQGLRLTWSYLGKLLLVILVIFLQVCIWQRHLIHGALFVLDRWSAAGLVMVPRTAR